MFLNKEKKSQYLWLRVTDSTKIFRLRVLDLVTSKGLPSCEYSCLSKEVHFPAWDVARVNPLMRPSYEPLLEAFDSYLTFKIVILLSYASVKRMQKLHVFSLDVFQRVGIFFTSCLFWDFDQDADGNFDRFSILSHCDCVGGDKDKLLCPVWAVRQFLKICSLNLECNHYSITVSKV